MTSAASTISLNQVVKESIVIDVKKSPNGKGFALRMTILIGLLALAVGGFYYDRFVLPKKAEATINEAYGLMTKPLDGSGITKQVVQETIGFAPQATSNQDGYEIETYSFSRVLPFLKGDFLNVIYENGTLVQILQNQDYDPEKVKMKMGIRPPDPKTFKGGQRRIGVGGGGDGSTSSDEDEADDEEAAEGEPDGESGQS